MGVAHGGLTSIHPRGDARTYPALTVLVITHRGKIANMLQGQTPTDTNTKPNPLKIVNLATL